MEELIFFAIIIFFSIIDSVARSRKKKRAGSPLPAPRAPQEWEPEEPTYDSGPSYDELEVEDSQPAPLPSYTQPYDSTGTSRGTSADSSQGMIPADIWEEIAGLAMGRTPTRRKPPPPVEVEAIPARPLETHRVHLSHAGYGTDPSSRAKSAEDDLDPLAHHLGADASAVRKQLKSHSNHALRQAVILQEVLGPPAALRPERFSE